MKNTAGDGGKIKNTTWEKLKNTLNKILDFLFPQHLICHICGNEAVVNEYGICRECESKLEFYSQSPAIEGIDGYTAGLKYNESTSRAMQNFKYGGGIYEKEFFLHFMEIPEDWRIDCVVPVPLTKKRRRKRGYNQSAVLAKQLCKRYNLKLREDMLVKSRDTKNQATLTAEERRKNLSGSFKASPECRGKTILLVDDVRTTGSTLRECALALKKKGALRVYAITACCVGTEKF